MAKIPDDKEILNLFTSDSDLSNEIIETHRKLFKKISKYKDFDLEKILIELPYLEKLTKYQIENIEILEINRLNPELITMTMYLMFRSILGKLMTLNNLTQPVVEKINSLFIDIFPNNLPDIFKNGIFIQSKNSILFDNVNKIVLYLENHIDHETIRIFLFYNNGYSTNASLSFSSILGKGIDEIDNLKLIGKFKNTDATLFRKALYLCIKFSLLIKTDKTPITVKDTNKSENIKRLKTVTERKNAEGWIEKTIYINQIYLSKNKPTVGTLYKDDKILKSITVIDHLRRLPNSGNEYIYINSFPSKRWIIEGNKKITYYFKEDI